jgi:FkbM family methyltransferase
MLEKILRCARITKYLPYARGIGYLLYVYRFFLRGKICFRVDDFDGNLKMDVDVRDVIGINLWHRPRFFEKNERTLFCQAIKPGSVVLDVGANVGIYTLLAAHRGARVFAIEADPRNVAMLQHHVHLNGFEHLVTIYPVAAGERAGVVRLLRDPGNVGHSNLFAGSDSVEVDCVTIDSLGLPPIDVCKMDVEGSELSALKGMEKTIERSPRMRMLAEYAEEFGQTSGMMEFIHSRFTEVYAVRNPPLGITGPLSATKRPPAFCNLWAHRS